MLRPRELSSSSIVAAGFLVRGGYKLENRQRCVMDYKAAAIKALEWLLRVFETALMPVRLDHVALRRI